MHTHCGTQSQRCKTSNATLRRGQENETKIPLSAVSRHRLSHREQGLSLQRRHTRESHLCSMYGERHRYGETTQVHGRRRSFANSCKRLQRLDASPEVEILSSSVFFGTMDLGLVPLVRLRTAGSKSSYSRIFTLSLTLSLQKDEEKIHHIPADQLIPLDRRIAPLARTRPQ